MIEAVSRIGDYVQRTKGIQDLISIFIENPNSKGKCNFVLTIILGENEGKYSFSRVKLDEFGDFDKYLYKKGASTAHPYVTPTAIIAGDIKKTFEGKILKWFKNCDGYDISTEDKEVLKSISTAINDQSEKMLAELQEKFSLMKSGENAIITLGVEKDGTIIHLADIPAFCNVLLLKAKDMLSTRTSQGTSVGKDAACSICKETKSEVYGFAIPWTFHTFDRPGFVAGGCNASNAWKNTPVCFDCAKRLQLGKKYVEENLGFNFAGFRYLLVPKLVRGEDYAKVLRILGDKDQLRKLNLNREVKNRIIREEDGILYLLKDQEDFFSNRLIFYKDEKSSRQILLLVEGVLPSRFKALFDAKEKVDKRFWVYWDLVLNESQKKENPLVFNFGVLRDFFPRESKNRTFDKTFLEIVNKIFIGKPVDYALLIDFVMRETRKPLINKGEKKSATYDDVTALNGFLLLHYINELGLFGNKKEEKSSMDEMECEVSRLREMETLPLEARVERFFEMNKAFFDNNTKKSVFLEGVLVQGLLEIQQERKGSTLFFSKLRGLNMNEDLIIRLPRDVRNKLEEYEENERYQDLEFIVSNLFLRAGAKLEGTDDELSFYFVLGMNMHRLFEIK